MSNVRLFNFEGLNENFSFLVLKIHQQLEDTLIALQHVDGFIPERMNNREDYINNLKIIIERKSYKRMFKARSEEDRIIRIMGSLNTVTSNMEEIGDYLMNIVTQTRYFQDRTFLGQYNYQAYFHEIVVALDLINESILQGKIKDALQICQAEIKIDNLFKNDFAALLITMKETQKIGDAITTFNILRYLERIGDSLLNIGEAIISAYAGTRLKLFEYMAIKDSLRRDTGEFLFQGMDVETKSGCRIEKIVTNGDARENQEVIFKEGNLAKIQQEKDKIEQWQSVRSGLTPKVFGFEYLNNKAFILLEYIGGFNFRKSF
jgi:Phosphate uptake regulator